MEYELESSPKSAIEMANISQAPRDRILWILTNNDGRMERSRLRARTGMRYSLLNPILEELVKEGRIRISNEIIILI
jgi:predicted transcriptional regulator